MKFSLTAYFPWYYCSLLEVVKSWIRFMFKFFHVLKQVLSCGKRFWHWNMQNVEIFRLIQVLSFTPYKNSVCILLPVFMQTYKVVMLHPKRCTSCYFVESFEQICLFLQRSQIKIGNKTKRIISLWLVMSSWPFLAPVSKPSEALLWVFSVLLWYFCLL